MAAKARLHWFWRGLIVTLLGVALFAALVLVAGRFMPERCLASGINAVIRLPGIVVDIISVSMVYTSVTVAVCLAVYARLSRDPARESGELHCRRCDHILRGISEPRCPECGERI